MAVPAIVPAFGYIGLGKQSLAGTGVAPTIFFPWQTLRSTPTFDSRAYRDGASRDVIAILKRTQYQDISFEMLVKPTEATAALNYYLGGTDGISGASDPYTHTQTSGNNSALYVSFEANQGNGQEVVRTTDCLISGVRFSCKAPDPLMCTVTVTGRVPVPGQSVASVTYSADRALVSADTTPAYTGINLGGGYTVNYVLDLKKQVKVIPVMGSVSPQLTSTMQDVMVQFDLLPADKNPWRDINFGSDSSTTLANALTTITSIVTNFDIGGTPDHNLQLTVNNVAATQGTGNWDINGSEYVVSGRGQAAVSGGTQVVSYSTKIAQSTAF